MAQHTFESLSAMNVSQLREIADGMEHDELHGFSTMHKEVLVPALCHAFGIPDHVVHKVVGIDKASIKKKIRALKVERGAALEAKDSAKVKKIRRQIHSLKRRIHQATV
jgi:hypothetical protein